MEEKIQGKKELTVEEIEAQMLLELPDRRLMQQSVNDNTITITQIAAALIGIFSF
jgi:hypothetical protein